MVPHSLLYVRPAENPFRLGISSALNVELPLKLCLKEGGLLFDIELYDWKICKVTLPADYLGYKGDDLQGFVKFLIKKYSIDYDEDILKIASDRITLRDKDSTWLMLISNGMTFGFVIVDIPVLFSVADETSRILSYFSIYTVFVPMIFGSLS